MLHYTDPINYKVNWPVTNNPGWDVYPRWLNYSSGYGLCYMNDQWTGGDKLYYRRWDDSKQDFDSQIVIFDLAAQGYEALPGPHAVFEIFAFWYPVQNSTGLWILELNANSPKPIKVYEGTNPSEPGNGFP